MAPGLAVYRYLLQTNLADGLLAIQQRYGDFVQLPQTKTLFITDPAAVEQVLQNNWRNYGKSPAILKTRLLLGNGLLLNEGASWQRQRRMMAPGFHRKRIASFFGVMVDCTDRMLQQWHRLAHADVVVDVSAEFNRLAMEIATKTLFSTTIDAAQSAEVAAILAHLLKLFQTRALLPFGFLDKLPLKSNKLAFQGIERLDEIVYNIIAERRQSAAEHHDLLAMLMDAQDEESGIGMSDQQLRDEVMTIFLAGFETTASSMAWTTLLLSQYRHERWQIRPKLASVFTNGKPQYEALFALSELRHIIDESLRLYPPGWIFGRIAKEADQINGQTLAAGTLVVASSYVMHRHPAYWDNPNRFMPARFTAAAKQSRPKFAYWPFGGGPRLCIGNQFALMEMSVVLAMMLLH